MIATVERNELHLVTPHSAAHGISNSREVLLLRLDADDSVGFGEASPLAGYTAETIEDCEAALHDLMTTALTEFDPDSPADSIAALPFLPAAARAAAEVALRDLAARRQGVPLWKAIGATDPIDVRVSHLVSATSRDELSREVRDARAQGFTAIKLKLGRGDDQDIDSVQIAREALGSNRLLAGDANGCWQLDHARTFVPALAELGLNLIDQMAELRGIAEIETALDEDSNSEDAFRFPKVADVCCIKLQACGGVDRMIERAAQARGAGMRVLIGSTLDGPIGIAAALHAAAVIKPDLPSGLATIQNIAEANGFQWIHSGAMTAPQGTGLGLIWGDRQDHRQ